MGFHEKSALACLVSILMVYSPYFWMVYQYPMAGLGLFIVAAIALIVLLTVFLIVNALATRSMRKSGDSPQMDELDRIIELQAAKVSGLVLALVVIGWCIVTMYGAVGASISTSETVSPSSVEPILVFSLIDALTGIHTLFAGFVIANITYYGRIVFGYRRLTRG